MFLEAYNSADPKRLERYNALYGRKTPPQDWIDMNAMTGRFTPMRVESGGPNEITVLLSAEIDIRKMDHEGETTCRAKQVAVT